MDGPWWLPACEPFVLPLSVGESLLHIGAAIFAFLDVLGDLYGTSEGRSLTALLEYKVPTHLPRLVTSKQVLALRPDFQLLETEAGLQLVGTELEICPAAQGFAHAMQAGYGLAPDLADGYAHFLNGRRLLIIGTHHWSEFLFEQLAFCRALAERDAQGWVLYDRPLKSIADDVANGRHWEPPIFGIRHKPPGWNSDLFGRVHAHGLADYWWADDEQWPEELGETVVFRFGYFNCFTAERLEQFGRWQRAGATFLNPTTYYLESKVVLAALQLRCVRERLPAGALAILDACLAKTWLLTAENLPRLLDDKDDWILKFAGYDDSGQDWGGRSLQAGRACSPAAWEAAVRSALDLPWPVIAQPFLPSQRVDIAYWSPDGTQKRLNNANTRLRSFLLRQEEGVAACGTHLTASANQLLVAESTDTVQTPVLYGKG
jgi:hypothetical protein